MMTDWSGQGLPPAAEARVARARAGGPWASLLTIAGETGLEQCGFRPVGEVMGCVVEHIGWQGWGGCGYVPTMGGFGGGFLGTVSTAAPQSYVGFGPYLAALYSGYDTALLRMLTECQGLGGDGVVGVTLRVNHLGNDNREFVCYGTAVRAEGTRRPASLFSSLLPGQDVAKLLHAGWVPVSIVVGLSIAIRHDDWATRQQATMMAGNTEVSGYSELVHHVRSDARHEFASRTATYGADGAILSSMGLNIWEQEMGENHRDHVALASVLGTAVARFHAGAAAPTRSITVLPLDTARRTP